MKYTCSVVINKPKKLVAQLFADPTLLHHYQDGFLRKNLVEGEAGQSGAVSKMYYQQGKGVMELTETIISNDLPDFFHGTYHHEHMDNWMKCTFSEVDENTTQYDSEFEYTAVRGFMPKMMFFFFPSMFKKQGQKWLDNFKVFVEGFKE